MMRVPLALIGLLLTYAAALAQPVQWVGNTKLFNNGLGQLPTKGAYVEKWHTITVTTQTYPITTGQTVTAIVSTDNWLTSQEYVFTFDFNVGNNSQWYRVLGPYPPGSDVQLYIRANGQANSVVYDNNSWQNFGFYSRYSPPFRRGAILQWFETDYVTMLKRLPEVVEAGYTAIYLPPPTKSGGGGFSVGYNPFDRFDLGDRLSLGTVRTKYGTAQELQELISVAKRFGLEVYCDAVYNHNDNRASTAINRYPDMIPEDFHIRSSADTGNSEINFNTEGPFTFGMLNHDLVGLADIAHEDHNNTRTGAFSLPSYASFNSSGKPSFVRQPRNPHYYPTGVPVAEDVRELLDRWGWFMTQVVGFDGFRLDAVKHVPPSFFATALGQPGSTSTNGSILPSLFNVSPETTIFAENFTSNAYELREFAKTGMNLLDFPLKFALDELFNSSGFGNLGSTLSNSFGLDPATGMPYERGGLGRDISVPFVQSHDQGPPWSNNIAHAFVLTRVGRPKIYFDGNNILPGNWSNFPKPGRGDALGSFGDTVIRLVDANLRFGRGDMVNRHVADRLYIYERQVSGMGVLLVGLNNRGDQTELSTTVQTAFAAGTVLKDLTGQKPNLTVGSTGTVTVVVPANTDSNSTNNARGYVVYAPLTPIATDSVDPLKIIDVASSQPFTFSSVSNPSGTHATSRSYRSALVNRNHVKLQLSTDGLGHSAWIKLDDGLGIAGLTPASNTSEGLLDGYVPMTKIADGQFVLDGVDLTNLKEGQHLIRTRVFTNHGTRPPVFTEFRTFFVHQKPSEISVDGDLSDLGNPIATQVRTPSSQGNRLDALLVTNDDRFLYFGLSGTVDTNEGLTNGLAMFLDTDPGSATGLRNFGNLDDDSGPAARLLSNALVNAPSGFGAEYGVAALRRSWHGTYASGSFAGDAVDPFTVGGFAGLFEVDGVPSGRLEGRPSRIAWQPRPTASGPYKGMEVAIPIEQFYSPASLNGSTSIGIVSYLLTTGEKNQTLLSSDVARGTLGGYGQPLSYLTNQFLPVQTFTSDPGFSSVNLGSSTRYFLKFATPQPLVRIMHQSFQQLPSGVWRENVLVMNRSGQTVSGPITLRLTLDPSIKVLNPSRFSLRQPTRPTITFGGLTLPPGASKVLTLEFLIPQGKPLVPSFEVFSGRGIL
ncbi:MAG TPA: alpha-amylase family glycosyl hydrolase [Fimbriimonadaceae bacterium]|nr:alpha-amylase family glycosyl hydrolase [Fimbriimonadaceae bacterium]